MRNRKQGKELVEEYAKNFSHLINKPVSISFGSHELLTVLQFIGLAKIADIENKPDMRVDGDKKYTPILMKMVCDGLNLVFVLEDIKDISLTLFGTIILIGDLLITIKSAE